MKEAGKVLMYGVSVVALGCLLAPPLFYLGHRPEVQSVIPQLHHVRFSSYFDRSIMLAALGLLWPFGRWIGFKNMRELGLRPNPRKWLHLVLGFLIGVGGLGACGTLIVVLGWASVQGRVVALDVARALGTGLVVAMIEEAFFRGAVFGAVRRSWPPMRALVLVSVLFAVAHFVKPNPAWSPEAVVGLWSGFALLPHVFAQFTDPRLIAGSLVTLFAVGFDLGYAVWMTSSLMMAIGLHAGWVFALKLFAVLAARQGPVTLWLGASLIEGVLPLAVVVLTLGVLMLVGRHRLMRFRPEVMP